MKKLYLICTGLCNELNSEAFVLQIPVAKDIMIVIIIIISVNVRSAYNIILESDDNNNRLFHAIIAIHGKVE